jgi:hypothetical protein
MTEMSTDPVVSPVYVLRQYVWKVLKQNMPDVWDENKYGLKIPIVPLAEETDLAAYPGPKIIYEYTVTDPQDQWYRGRGSMSFAVLDSDFRRLTKTLNILEHALGRLDETANDINWSMMGSGFEGQVGFGYVGVQFVDGGSPEQTEGGNQIGVLNIRYDYFVNYDVSTVVSL